MFNPWVGKTPGRRKWQPTPVFLPRESHGQRSLVGNSPRGHKESDTTKHAHMHVHAGWGVRTRERDSRSLKPFIRLESCLEQTALGFHSPIR